MGKLIVLLCTFIGALVLTHTFAPVSGQHTALTFAGRTVSWALLFAIIATLFAWRLKGR